MDNNLSEIMSKIIYIYFGDNMFQKHKNLIDIDASLYCAKADKIKIFNSLKSQCNVTIDDVFLGWSFIVLRAGRWIHIRKF